MIFCVKHTRRQTGRQIFVPRLYGVLAERNRGDTCKTESLQNAGFAMTAEAIQALGDDIVQEDTFADFHGVGSFSISGWRQRRNLGLISGWPKRLQKCNIPGKATATINEFLQDRKIKIDIEGKTDEITKGARLVLDRHILNKTSNIQHEKILQKFHGKPSPEHNKVLKKQATGLLQTQIVEDVINQQKNSPCTKAHNRFKRPFTP